MKNKCIESMKYGFIVTGMIVIVFFIGYCLFKVMGVYFAFLLSSLGIFGLVTLIHWVWNYKEQTSNKITLTEEGIYFSNAVTDKKKKGSEDDV
ncbi:hypothetical protein [Carnobacterium maltaromaticum]|uniref:hypothetical protein n=1 Tax=Carnobacterium maltaromaticum TaxID=2751 RepID=UPI0039BECE0F